jgi:hypothetical protein
MKLVQVMHLPSYIHPSGSIMYNGAVPSYSSNIEPRKKNGPVSVGLLALLHANGAKHSAPRWKCTTARCHIQEPHEKTTALSALEAKQVVGKKPPGITFSPWPAWNHNVLVVVMRCERSFSIFDAAGEPYGVFVTGLRSSWTRLLTV